MNAKAREEMKKMTHPHRKEYEMIEDLLKTEDSDDDDETLDSSEVQRRKGIRAESPFFKVI